MFISDFSLFISFTFHLLRGVKSQYKSRNLRDSFTELTVVSWVTVVKLFLMFHLRAKQSNSVLSGKSL